MSSLARWSRCLGLVGLWMLLAGCSPSEESRLDEQKDPNYLAGKRRWEAMDYTGAVESFERAIEANPRSASAHYEIAVVCYENTKDWAAAIYHFEKYLKLNPTSHRADTVRQLIGVCKQELAKGVPLTSLGEKELANVRKLASENNDLRQQIEQLKAQLAQRGATPTIASVPESKGTNLVPVQQNLVARADPPAERPKPPASRDPQQSTPSARTYVVKAGDTPAAIARANGISISSLLNANPGIEPRRIKPGQPLNLPLR